MTITADDPALRAAYWPLPVIRAIPVAVLAIVITFSADHSAAFGLTAFGVFGLVCGAAIAVLAWLRLRSTGVRPYIVAQGVVTVLMGALALVIADSVAGLFLVVTVWAALSGALEAYSGLRTRRRHAASTRQPATAQAATAQQASGPASTSHPASTDWLTVGVITMLMALVMVLIPPDFAQRFVGPDDVPRVLDASVIAVGLLGAYAAIIAVYLLIVGFSAKWGPQDSAAPSRTTAKGNTP
ncbi:hypothetical protein [Marisediminicola senii]|uniref:hypothetical protein n=1 Tax=Marisediminicola senii TaxID=2711233 RepID=UPI0013EBEA69|nr:hypothetical protein [Marisediminicola senii]